MNKQIIINFLLLAIIVGSLFFYQQLSSTNTPKEYYFVPIYYTLIYSLQSAILNRFKKTKKVFISIYNFTSILKMLMSAIVLTTYYLLVGDKTTAQSKVYFAIFFATHYFVYLIINVFLSFKNKSGMGS
tara:strand:- start:4436 stop:4822 length:387 start_codon:yes stop_codon:yes gene_type:complete